jgi:subtilisin-like proprotein convertase family protein
MLTSPDGNQIALFDRSGGSTARIVASLRCSYEPELFAGLKGKPAAGTWQLQATDLASQDVGVLKSRGIAVAY